MKEDIDFSLEACNARIERWQPRLNAFIAREMLAAGKSSGPLAGVPMAHKDMFYRAGKFSNCGSKILKGWVASDTSAALERLDAAGAMQIGTLGMAEFAYNPTGHNQHWGDCCNAWNPDYIAGGSSSGSGAAVAARLVWGALGSDTGGSVRIPAAVNGITGLKTTWGRVSRHGAMPLAHSLDTVGPLARSAEDCGQMFEVIAGYDERDSITSREPVGDFRKVAKPSLTISTAWIEKHVEPEVAAAVLAAAKELRAAGLNVKEAEAPDFEALSVQCSTILSTEASAQHLPWMRTRPQDYGSAVRARLDAGYAVPATAYIEALRLRGPWLDRFCATTLASADAYLLPTMTLRVPTRAETGPGGADSARLLPEITRLTRWVNYLGLPALVLPCGFDSRGLPISMQIVGRPFAEATVLAAGHAYQGRTDWHQRVPTL